MYKNGMLGMLRISAGWALCFITSGLHTQWAFWIQAGWILVMILLPYCLLTEARFDRMCARAAAGVNDDSLKDMIAKSKALDEEMKEISELAKLGKAATDALVPCAAALHGLLLLEEKGQATMPGVAKDHAWRVMNESKAATLAYLQVSSKSTLFPVHPDVADIQKGCEKIDEARRAKGEKTWDVL